VPPLPNGTRELGIVAAALRSDHAGQAGDRGRPSVVAGVDSCLPAGDGQTDRTTRLGRETSVHAIDEPRFVGRLASVRPYSGDVLDHLDELVDGISLPLSELDQLPNPLHDSAALGGPGHGGPATASKFEQPLVLKQPQRAQDGVRVDSEDSREFSRRREPGLVSPGAALTRCAGRLR
jgi:hypothetical protein